MLLALVAVTVAEPFAWTEPTPSVAELGDAVRIVALVDRTRSENGAEAVRWMVESAQALGVGFVDPAVGQAAYEASNKVVGLPMEASVVRSVCDSAGAQAVFALEELKVTMIQASDETNLVTGAHARASWRTYRCDGAVHDEAQVVGRHSGYEGAQLVAGEAPTGFEAAELAPMAIRRSTRAYVERYTGGTKVIRRDVLATGHSSLRGGYECALVGDFECAESLWSEATGTGNFKWLRASGHYNLAVLDEAKGDIPAARAHVQRCRDLATLSPWGQCQSYLELLDSLE